MTEHDGKTSDDDEIKIDFGKIKNIFKKKEQHSTPHSHPHSPVHTPTHHHDSAVSGSSDDEISFDFSKIKNVFKKVGSSSAQKEPDTNDDITINWGSMFTFFKKYGTIFLVLIPLLLAVYIRMLPDSVPLADEWAQNNVYTGLRSTIRSEIDGQYPNLPEATKTQYVAKKMDEVVRQNKQQIEQQIAQTSQYIKAFFKDDAGYTYMPDIDPYYWVRYAQNIIKNGHPGDELRNGIPFDNHQLAPLGRTVTDDMFHAYSLASLHTVMRMVSPSITIVRSASYYPVIISALSVLFAFLIGKKIAGNTGGFFAALALASNASFIGRTLFGHVDSDAWVIFFPLLVILFFVYGIDAKNTILKTVLLVLSGFGVGIYSYAWGGWWYIFDFLIVGVIAYGAYSAIYELRHNEAKKVFHHSNPTLRNVFFVIGVFFLASMLSVTLFTGFSTFASAFTNPLGSSSLKSPTLAASSAGSWPNVLTTVAELNPGSLNQVIDSVGGKLLWYIGIFGIVLLLIRPIYVLAFKKNNAEESGKEIFFAVLLAVWLAATAYASLLGIRFTLLVAPVFSLAFGAALGKIYQFITSWVVKELHIHKMIAGTLLILMFLPLYASPIQASIATGKNDLPIVNDTWYHSLMAIKNNSTPEAIITSWWDFGHHFKFIADRPVSFDGTTQTFYPAHWVGRLLSTYDEHEAIGILRMLDCSGNGGYNYLMNTMKYDDHQALHVIKDIIPLGKKQADNYLETKGFTDEQKKELLSKTHCDSPREGYFIASNDMIGKSGVWGHFGAWNFERADIWSNTRRMPTNEAVEYMVKKFNYSKEQAENLHAEVLAIPNDREGNNWIAPWPGYAGEVNCHVRETDNVTLDCDNGFVINMTTYDVYAQGQQGIVHPQLFAYLNADEELVVKKFNESTIGAGVTFVENGGPKIIVSSPELTGGMFTRMFYMGGKGLENFELLFYERGLVGTEIYVYKAKWPLQ